MNKLYSLAFKRVLASLSAQEIKPTNVEQILTSNDVKPVGSFVFHRLPRDEVRNFIKNPCPVHNTQSEWNKKIIQSSKSLRASFSIEEDKVCNRCPFKDICPQYAKMGKQNGINAMADLLIYMQAMNDKAELEETTQMRIWASGYKSSDSVIATLEDLKEEGTQTLQYERIRLQYITERSQQQAMSRKLKDLDKVDLVSSAKTQKKQRKQKRDNINAVLGSQSKNPNKKRQQKLKEEQYQLFQEQQEQQQWQNQNLQSSKNKQKPSEYYRQSLNEKSSKQRKKKQAEKYQRATRQNKIPIKEEKNMQQDFQPFQRRERRKERIHAFENKNQPKDDHIRNKYEKHVIGQDGKERVYNKRRENLKKYTNTWHRQTENSPFEEGRSGIMPKLKPQGLFYQNQIDVDRLFKIGQASKNPQVFQAWEDAQEKKSSEYKLKKAPNSKPKSVKEQKPVSQRRGRKIRR